ncbi:hypothetical protein RFI_27667 [Reticulomyxa filosa]|uniref:Uncharacterized protein n=1 Tax=Reticulomyxa filosa TaxID=46433 RepID=X6M9L9_RETFI|nr:hypothetical protein RFI_27667 [Reticulomyxa filosa]|eukprot:ETO09710.1 hypothetical protein RFI_27667 [Reticulomyxa filosa]
MILSGANTELIKIILEGKELSHIFPMESHIFTNPARWEECKSDDSSNGDKKSAKMRLRVDSYIRKSGKIDCTVCHADEDLCKGAVLRQIIQQCATASKAISTEEKEDREQNDKTQTSFDRIVYIGDGYNDLCPLLHMQKHDFVLVRKGKALEQLIDANQSHIQSQVLKWEDGRDLLLHFQSIFQCVKF